MASTTGSREDRLAIHRCTRLWKHWRALSGKPGSRSTDSQQARPASMTLLPSSSTTRLALPCTDCLQLPFLPSSSASPTILSPPRSLCRAVSVPPTALPTIPARPSSGYRWNASQAALLTPTQSTTFCSLSSLLAPAALACSL